MFSRNRLALLVFLIWHEHPDGEAERWALYTFTFGESGHVMMAIYFDAKEDIDVAKKIWMSIIEK